jgi:hypothetical protein
MRAGVFVVALMLLQAAPAQANLPPPSVDRPLADRLDVAFRTCALQLTRRDYLTAKNQKTLGEVGITLASPPPDVQAMAARLVGNEGLYASVSAPQGQIWISASATVPACKVTLGDTELALSGRLDWTSTLRSSTIWRYDKARSGGNGQIQRDFFVLNPDRPGGHMIMFIDGPYSVVNDGKGIQMIMTVALEAAKAQ